MSAPESVADAIKKLRDGKRRLRARRIAASLPEKVQEVVKLQRLTLPLLQRRRALRSWERVWWTEK